MIFSLIKISAIPAVQLDLFLLKLVLTEHLVPLLRWSCSRSPSAL